MWHLGWYANSLLRSSQRRLCVTFALVCDFVVATIAAATDGNEHACALDMSRCQGSSAPLLWPLVAMSF